MLLIQVLPKLNLVRQNVSINSHMALDVQKMKNKATTAMSILTTCQLHSMTILTSLLNIGKNREIEMNILKCILLIVQHGLLALHILFDP